MVCNTFVFVVSKWQTFFSVYRWNNDRSVYALVKDVTTWWGWYWAENDAFNARNCIPYSVSIVRDTRCGCVIFNLLQRPGRESASGWLISPHTTPRWRRRFRKCGVAWLITCCSIAGINPMDHHTLYRIAALPRHTPSSVPSKIPPSFVHSLCRMSFACLKPHIETPAITPSRPTRIDLFRNWKQPTPWCPFSSLWHTVCVPYPSSIDYFWLHCYCPTPCELLSLVVPLCFACTIFSLPPRFWATLDQIQSIFESIR